MSTCKFFKDHNVHSRALRARALLLSLKDFTRAYLFRIALEIMRLSILIISFTIQFQCLNEVTPPPLPGGTPI